MAFISGSIQHDLINSKDGRNIVVSAFRAGTRHPGYIYDISKIDGMADGRRGGEESTTLRAKARLDLWMIV